MKLYEYQAKQIFSQYGLRVPKGNVAYSPVDAGKILDDIGAPVAIKAQVLVGGRGLAGGIGFAENRDKVVEIAADILSRTLKNEEVSGVLVEKKVPIIKEYFAGATIDYEAKSPTIIASARGGVDIESIALEHPNEIVKENIDTNLGLTDFVARRIAKRVGLTGRSMLSFAAILRSLYQILLDYDATLVEVNPMALTSDDSFIAVDAKLVLDESSSFRHQKTFSELEAQRPPPSEGTRQRKDLAHKADIPTYIELGGNIGIIADGAGTGMLTLDLVGDFEGDVESYCELGGRATPELIEKAMEIVLSNEKIEVLLINLIGGLNRMDEMAKGIVSFFTKRKRPSREPRVVVRMSGTLEDEGREMVKNIGVEAYASIYDAIEKAVELARRD